MPVVDDGDYEIARFCDGDRGEAAERHQLFAVAGDDKNNLFRLRLCQPQTDKSGGAHGAPKIVVVVAISRSVDVIACGAETGDDEGVFPVGEKRLDRFPTG